MHGKFHSFVLDHCSDAYGHPEVHHFHSYFILAHVLSLHFQNLAMSSSSFIFVKLMYSKVTYNNYQSEHSLPTGLNNMFT